MTTKRKGTQTQPERKIRAVRVPASDEEYGLLRAAANIEGEQLGKWVREVCLAEARRVLSNYKTPKS